MAEPTPESAEGLTDPRIAAMLPPELLDPAEIIILLIKPSPWFIILTSLRSIVIVVLLGFVVVTLDGYEYLPILRRDAMLILMGLVAMRLFWALLEWLSRVYVLTDQRVVRVKGVIRVQVFEAPLKQIQHTNTWFSLAERLLGLGTIGFFTAGSGTADAFWVMLAQPLDIHQTVVRALRRYR